ncbi:hypothetical protein LTR85_005199 [Meristemomyces frigidus]|nr:hypothetical protein LTR85_005199 [Meristemomyces frigidus]
MPWFFPADSAIDRATAGDSTASKFGTPEETHTATPPSSVPSPKTDSVTINPYMSTYVNCHGEIVTEPLTADDFARLCALGNAGQTCNANPVPLKLRASYDFLTYGFVTYLLTPSGPRLFAFIKQDPLQKHLLELVAGFALTEVERIEKKYGSFMHPWYDGINKPPIRLDQLEIKMAELVRLLAQLGKPYQKYTFLGRYEAWQKGPKKAEAEVQAEATGKATNTAGGPPMVGAAVDIAVR